MRKDYRQHLVGGIAVCAAMFVVIVVASYSAPLALAVGGILVSVGVEINQKIRKEGEPSWQDAAYGSTFSCVAAAVWWFVS